jgi:hypothetical protein
MQEMKRSQEGTVKQQVSGGLKSAGNFNSKQINDNYEEDYEEHKTEMARMPSGMSRQDIKLNNNSAMSA